MPQFCQSFARFSILVLLFSINFSCIQPDIKKEKETVITVAEDFLKALSARDSLAARQFLLPQGCITSVRGDGSIRSQTHQEFLESIAVETNGLLETMKNPKVWIQGSVAVVWADYDFFLNGKYSHCGVDVFSMLKTREGWRISGLSYSVVKGGCKGKR